LSSLPTDFFYFNSAWDSTSEPKKTLLNLSEQLVKEEEKLKHATQNPIDVTKAFYSRLSPRFPASPITNHLYHDHKYQHPSHSSLIKSSTVRLPPASNPNGSPLSLEQRQTRQKYFDDLKKTTVCHNCGHQGCLCARPPASPLRPPRPPDKEISSIFEYIRAYSSIFEVFFKNIQRICPICLVRARHARLLARYTRP
jgi:hypothetical protein